MNLEQAKKIMENADPKILEAYKTISGKQLMIFINNYEKQLKEKNLIINSLHEQRSDLIEAKDYEDFKRLVKNINDYGDTKDYIDPYN